MARVRVPVDETSDESISAKAAQLLGEERQGSESQKQRRPKKNLPKISYKKLAAIGVALLLLAVLVVLIKDRSSLQRQVNQLNTQSTPEQDQANELVNIQTELSKFMELPANETPTLATVSDAEKVQNQAFFKNAQDGDKVLLYAKSGKAILYRPTTKKVIEVAQINTPAADQTPMQP